MTSIVSLEGQELAEVVFVRDYIQLGFDGPVLTLLTPPTVKAKGASLQFPKPGSRDLLCSLIGFKVAKVLDEDPQVVQLIFSNDVALSIPLDDRSRVGPEAMHFHDGIGGPMVVW
jgi:hypothetical protein